MSAPILPPTLRQQIRQDLDAADLADIDQGRPVVIFSGSNNTNLFNQAGGTVTIQGRQATQPPKRRATSV